MSTDERPKRGRGAVWATVAAIVAAQLVGAAAGGWGLRQASRWRASAAEHEQELRQERATLLSPRSSLLLRINIGLECTCGSRLPKALATVGVPLLLQVAREH